MALYDRLLGYDDAGATVDNKIRIHQFVSLMAEFGRGRITGPQAQAAVTQISGAPLDAGEVTETQALLATITGSAVAKLARAKEIDDVLILAERKAFYATPSSVKTRLGV